MLESLAKATDRQADTIKFLEYIVGIRIDYIPTNMHYLLHIGSIVDFYNKTTECSQNYITSVSAVNFHRIFLVQ